MNDLKKDHDLMLDMAGSGEIKKKSSSPESGRQSPPGSNPAQVILFLFLVPRRHFREPNSAGSRACSCGAC